MLETYAITQELVVWTKSYPVGRPIYHKESARWNMVVNHDGREVELHPAHIILATGTLGAPYTPPIADRDTFNGIVIHATEYKNPTPFKEKEVVVVGTGQTAADITEDLAKAGIPVTMVQRSPTVVSDRDWEMGEVAGRAFPQGVPAEVSDFKLASLPRGYMRKMYRRKEVMQQYVGAQAELHEKLRRGGVILNLDKPNVIAWFERMGGELLALFSAAII